jgi:hypothetical protein
LKQLQKEREAKQAMAVEADKIRKEKEELQRQLAAKTKEQ